MPGAPTDLRSLARSWTELGVRTLAGIAQHSENDSARVAAVGLLFERGWGKAPQAHTGADGEGAIEFVVRHIIEGSRNVSEPGMKTVGANTSQLLPSSIPSDDKQ